MIALEQTAFDFFSVGGSYLIVYTFVREFFTDVSWNKYSFIAKLKIIQWIPRSKL